MIYSFSWISANANSFTPSNTIVGTCWSYCRHVYCWRAEIVLKIITITITARNWTWKFLHAKSVLYHGAMPSFANTCCSLALNLCVPSQYQFIVAGEIGLVETDWVGALLHEWMVPATLKEAVVQPLLEKPVLDPVDSNNYCLVTNPFWGMWLKGLWRNSWLRLIIWIHSSLGLGIDWGPNQPWLSRRIIFRKRGRGDATLFLLLNLSRAFNTLDHGILLHQFCRMCLSGTVL